MSFLETFRLIGGNVFRTLAIMLLNAPFAAIAFFVLYILFDSYSQDDAGNQWGDFNEN